MFMCVVEQCGEPHHSVGMSGSSLPQAALGYFKKLRNTEQNLSILVIG